MACSAARNVRRWPAAHRSVSHAGSARDCEAVNWGSVADWVSGIGSLSAAIVALYVAHLSRRIHLTGYCGHRLILGGGGPREEIVSISVTNIGQRTTTISNVGMTVGYFAKRHAVINIVRDKWSDGV